MSGCDFCSKKGLEEAWRPVKCALYGKMQQSRGPADSTTSGLKMVIAAVKLKAAWIQLGLPGERPREVAEKAQGKSASAKRNCCSRWDRSHLE